MTVNLWWRWGRSFSRPIKSHGTCHHLAQPHKTGPLGRGPTCVAGDETAPWEVERNATLCEVLPLPLEGPKHLQAVRLLCQCCLPRHLWLFCAECSPPWTYLPFHPAAHPGSHNPHLAFAHLEWKVPHLCCWYPSRACGGCLVPALCSFSLEEPEPSS